MSWPHPIDLDAVAAASALLLGEHDFAAFCKRREGATTVRALECFSWTRGDDGVVRAEVSADAFCHSMVRSLVGAMLDVGRGRRPVEWPGGLLARDLRADPMMMFLDRTFLVWALGGLAACSEEPQCPFCATSASVCSFLRKALRSGASTRPVNVGSENANQ